MRKTYIAPSTRIIRIETTRIVAMSDPRVQTTNDKADTNVVEALTKGYTQNNLWDNEW